MYSHIVRAALSDIAEHVNLAREFTAGETAQSLASNRKAFLAASRCLGIISVAASRLPDGFKQQHARIAWGKIDAAGEIYHDDGERVDAATVFAAVHAQLPPLLNVVQAALGDA